MKSICTERKNCQPRILYLVRLPFREEGAVKTFPDKQELWELDTTRPVLQNVIKEVHKLKQRVH